MMAVKCCCWLRSRGGSQSIWCRVRATAGSSEAVRIQSYGTSSALLILRSIINYAAVDYDCGMPLNHELAQSSNRSRTTARTGSAGQSDSRSQRCLFGLQTHNWSSRPSQSWTVLYHGSQKVLQSTRLAYLILYSQINKQRSSLVLWTHPMNTTTNTGVTLKWLSPGMQVNTRDINFTKGTSSTAIYLTAMPSSSPGFQSGSDSGHPRFQISSSFLSLQQFSAADFPALQVWAWSWAETHACTECWAHLSLVTTTPWRWSSSPSGVT